MLKKKYSKVKKSITIPIKISVSSLDLKFHAWASQQKKKLGWDSGAKIIQEKTLHRDWLRLAKIDL